MTCIHAYTENLQAAGVLVGYLSLNTDGEGRYFLTVRARGDGTQQATLEMSPEQLEHLATDILAGINENPKKPSVLSVIVNGITTEISDIDAPTISYEQLCKMVNKPVQSGISITYLLPDGRSGMINFRGDGPLAHGAIYNVMVCGNA